MIVYAVFKQGVYRHECGGIFKTKDGAIAAAKSLADGDNDDYHDYTVIPFVIDRAGQQKKDNNNYNYGPWFDEPEEIARFTKPSDHE